MTRQAVMLEIVTLGGVCLLTCGSAAQAAVTLSVTPGSVNFSYVQGAALPAAKTVSVKASLGTPAYITVVMPGALWLTVSPDAGTLPATPSIRVNPTGLTVGI